MDAKFNAEIPPATQWTDPGWRWNGTAEDRLPTFMRSIRKAKRGFLPAGLAATPAGARSRWKRDRWRFPPYQYKTKYCMRNTGQPNKLRVLFPTEREILMYLGKSFTTHALNPVKAKDNPEQFQDVRASWIGISFHAGVMALLLAPLLKESNS